MLKEHLSFSRKFKAEVYFPYVFIKFIALDTFFSIFSFSKSCKLFRKGFFLSFSRLLLASCCQLEALPLHPLLFILNLALNLTDHCQGYAFLARRLPILPHRQQLLGFNSEKGHPAAQTGHEMHFLPPTCWKCCRLYNFWHATNISHHKGSQNFNLWPPTSATARPNDNNERWAACNMQHAAHEV